VEQLSRLAKLSVNLSLKVLEGMLEGLIKGILECFGPERLSMFIENDWNILDSVYYGLYRPPIEAYVKMSREEALRLEGFRRNLAKTVLPIMGFARTITSRFPAEAVENKITGEWLLSKCEKKFPKLAEVINRHGEKGRIWLERQAEQIRDYLLGRIVYDPRKMKFVKVEELKHAEKEG